MNPFRRRALQTAAVLPLCLAKLAWTQDAGSRAPGALGYLPWWMAAGWKTLPLRNLDRLVLFDAPVLPDGTLQSRDWRQLAPGLIAHAERASLALELALTLLQEGLFDRVFGDPAARDRLLAECTRQLAEPYVAGLHLDIEGYDAAAGRAVAGFRTWLAALEERSRSAGKRISGFFPASDSFAAYDSSSAQRLDYWVAQLYDAHWPESKVTGPVVTRRDGNPVAVPRALARLAAIGVPRHKVLLSVPLYGWQWPSESGRPGAAALGKARLLTFARTPRSLMPNDRLVATELAKLHGLRRDAEQTPYYAYREGTQWLQGWYEDLTSLTSKFGPERSAGYAGLAFFPLGYDRGDIVEAMLRWWRSPGS
jgi:hypothetical protein